MHKAFGMPVVLTSCGVPVYNSTWRTIKPYKITACKQLVIYNVCFVQSYLVTNYDSMRDFIRLVVAIVHCVRLKMKFGSRLCA